MRVVIAGGTGVVGSRLAPLLAGEGHDVTVLSRSGGDLQVDALDRQAVRDAVASVRPDAVVNLLTAIPRNLDPRRFEREMAQTNRLRAEGTRNLIEAAGTAKIVSASIAFGYAPGPGLADEDSPLWRDGPKPFRPVIEAVDELERSTTEASGIVLRLGHLYGPGTAFAEQLGAGRLPVVGDGGSVFSFVHVDDAAAAISAALAHDGPAVYNVVDDDPAPAREWIPYLADKSGAPRPKKVPPFVARLFAGEWGVAFLTSLRGASNARARNELDWQPSRPTWRDGF